MKPGDLSSLRANVGCPRTWHELMLCVRTRESTWPPSGIVGCFRSVPHKPQEPLSGSPLADAAP
ncbi:MAG: hypothetical protein ACK559_20005 [bacterium]